MPTNAKMDTDEHYEQRAKEDGPTIDHNRTQSQVKVIFSPNFMHADKRNARAQDP